MTKTSQAIPETIIDLYGYKNAKILCDALISGLENGYEQELAPLLEPLLDKNSYLMHTNILANILKLPLIISVIYDFNPLVIDAVKFSASKLHNFAEQVGILKANTPPENNIVCYKAMDGVFNTPKDTYVNINYDCLITNSIRIGGDGFSNKFESGKVIAIDIETNLYKTEAKAYHSSSECNGLDSWRSYFNYHYITEEQLEACGAIADQDIL